MRRTGRSNPPQTVTRPSTDSRPWSIPGDPTEAALLALAMKRGIDQSELVASCPRVEELTFDSDRRRMATLHVEDDHVWVAAKGALDAMRALLGPGQADDRRE